MKCQQCKDWEFKKLTGSWFSGPAFNRWAVWGCTCDPLDLASKVHYLDYAGRRGNDDQDGGA